MDATGDFVMDGNIGVSVDVARTIPGGLGVGTAVFTTIGAGCVSVGDNLLGVDGNPPIVQPIRAMENNRPVPMRFVFFKVTLRE